MLIPTPAETQATNVNVPAGNGGTPPAVPTNPTPEQLAARTTAATISSTPPVISSKDMAGSFAQNSAALTSTTLTQDQARAANQGKPGFDVLGNPIPGYTPPGTEPPPKTDATSTGVEKGAQGGAGTGAQPIVSTGDPIYDSLQSWEKDQESKNEAAAKDQKAQVQSMLTTNLAANDATYGAQILGIQNTYNQLIDTQNRINSLNIGRVKAYGLSSGNAMSTPIEFTYAVSNEEETAASAIQKLDDSRDSLIATAKAAMVAGDAKLLQDSMDSITKVESDMRSQATALQSQVDARFTTLKAIQKDQQDQLVKTQQTLLASAITNYGQQYADEKDPAKKDALIKSIVSSSGGQLDYGAVFGSLSANATTLATAKTQAAKDAADLKLKGAQTAEAFANAQKTQQGNVQSEAFSAIDDRLKPGVPIDGRTDGGTYLDTNGYLTKDGFTTLLKASHDNSVSRATFLKEYGGWLSPDGYANYGLTKAEQDMLTNTNKVTPIIIPQTTQNGQ